MGETLTEAPGRGAWMTFPSPMYRATWVAVGK